MTTVVVLGGGISGLSAAYYLLKHGKKLIKKVILFEASQHLGGWIKSTRFPDGTVYEQGPHSLRPVGEAGETTFKMVEDLRLSSQIIAVPRDHVTKNRFLLIDDQLHCLPNSLAAVFKTKPPFSRPLIFYAVKDLYTKPKILKDESMYSFMERRFGTEIADILVDPLCRGVYAGNAKEISVKALMRPLFEAEQKYGSVLKGIILKKRANSDGDLGKMSDLGKLAKERRWATWNFINGLQTLPTTLSKWLMDEGAEIHLNSACKHLKFESDNTKAELEDGSAVSCDHIIAALPAAKLAKLLNEKHEDLARNLAFNSSVTVAVVILDYSGSPQDLLPQQAFGFLIPSNQPYPVLGVIFDSCCFSEHNGKLKDHTRLTVMMGGHWFEQLFGNPDTVNHDDLLQTAKTFIHRQLGISAPLLRHQTSLLKNCLPQYSVGHFERVDSMRQYINQHSLSLSLTGASYDGVSVNDCIYSAKKVINKYLGL